MQKKSFLRLLLGTFGYAAMGNLMGAVITISLGAFGIGDILMAIAAICSILTYLMMIFNAGHKDGEIDRKLFQRKQIEKPDFNKWVKIGCIVFAFYCVACAFLFIFTGSGGESGTMIHVDGGYLNPFRIIFAAVMAVSLLLGSAENPIWSPFVFMGVYALTPFICRLGYWVAFYEKLTIDNIVYKKKK